MQVQSDKQAGRWMDVRRTGKDLIGAGNERVDRDGLANRHLSVMAAGWVESREGGGRRINM